jgi:Zn finger protein HypA/HybF involved in hydrogenase expression
MKDYVIKIDKECKIKIPVNGFKCLRCEHRWIPRVELEQLEGEIKELPKICPKCKSPYWYKNKKNGENKEVKK